MFSHLKAISPSRIPSVSPCSIVLFFLNRHVSYTHAVGLTTTQTHKEAFKIQFKLKQNAPLLRMTHNANIT